MENSILLKILISTLCADGCKNKKRKGREGSRVYIKESYGVALYVSGSLIRQQTLCLY